MQLPEDFPDCHQMDWGKQKSVHYVKYTVHHGKEAFNFARVPIPKLTI